MRVQRLSGCCAGEQEQVALGEIDQRVEDGGFGAVEACGAEGVDYHRPQEGAVEVVRWGGHFVGEC